MLCEKYNNLTIPERLKAIREVVHALQNDNEAFVSIMDAVKDAELRGVFNGVVINPETNKKQ
jgi:phosphopantetheine adenylyltransferase